MVGCVHRSRSLQDASTSLQEPLQQEQASPQLVPPVQAAAAAKPAAEAAAAGKAKVGGKRSSAPGVTQISPPTASDARSRTRAHSACQSLTILSLEVHTKTKGQMKPNPGRRASTERAADPGDEVAFVWYALKEDQPQDAGAAAAAIVTRLLHLAALRHGLILRVDECAVGENAQAVAERAKRRYRGLLKAELAAR